MRCTSMFVGLVLLTAVLYLCGEGEARLSHVRVGVGRHHGHYARSGATPHSVNIWRSLVNIGRGGGTWHTKDYGFLGGKYGRIQRKRAGRYCRGRKSGRQPRDCRDAANNGCRGNGLTWIKPRGTNGFWAYCQGPWTVIQRRWYGHVNFYRPWKDYTMGFPRTSKGQLDARSDFWVGNENLHALTSQRKVRLSVDLWKHSQTPRSQNPYYRETYKTFAVGNRYSKFKLRVSGGSGNAGSCMQYDNNMKFSTYDADNDKTSTNCAEHRLGAWWYKSCGYSNLNGLFYEKYFTRNVHKGINWSCAGTKYSLRAQMRIK